MNIDVVLQSFVAVLVLVLIGLIGLAVVRDHDTAFLRLDEDQAGADAE